MVVDYRICTDYRPFCVDVVTLYYKRCSETVRNTPINNARESKISVFYGIGVRLWHHGVFFFFFMLGCARITL